MTQSLEISWLLVWQGHLWVLQAPQGYLPIHSQLYSGPSVSAQQLLTHSPGHEVNKTSSNSKNALSYFHVRIWLYMLFADSSWSDLE